jgi:hypothetical protein
MTIIAAPPQALLHEGMQFAAAHHTEVAIRLFALWAAVSLAAHSRLGHLPIAVSQSGAFCTWECGLQQLTTPRWLYGYSPSGQRCL